MSGATICIRPCELRNFSELHILSFERSVLQLKEMVPESSAAKWWFSASGSLSNWDGRCFQRNAADRKEGGPLPNKPRTGILCSSRRNISMAASG